MKNKLKKLEKRVTALEKKVKNLQKTKEDRKVYGHSNGKLVTKDDLLKCHKCGKNIFDGCRCKK